MSDHKMQVIIKSYDKTEYRTEVSAEEDKTLIAQLKNKQDNISKLKKKRDLFIELMNKKERNMDLPQFAERENFDNSMLDYWGGKVAGLDIAIEILEGVGE